MGMYYEGGGGAVIAHKALLLIACGGRGRREHPPLPYIQSNTCRFLFLLSSYLRFAEAASFDKKELRRSCTAGIYFDNRFFRHQACYSLLPARPGYMSCQAKRLDSRYVGQCKDCQLDNRKLYIATLFHPCTFRSPGPASFSLFKMRRLFLVPSGRYSLNQQSTDR